MRAPVARMSLKGHFNRWGATYTMGWCQTAGDISAVRSRCAIRGMSSTAKVSFEGPNCRKEYLGMALRTWTNCVAVRELVLGTIGIVLSHSLTGVQRKPHASLACSVNLTCHVPSVVFKKFLK